MGSMGERCLALSNHIKLWFVRRWLRLLPEKELEQELLWREHARMINEMWDKEIITMMPMPIVGNFSEGSGSATSRPTKTTKPTKESRNENQ